MQGAAQTCN